MICPPADGSSTRGGSTSIRGCVCAGVVICLQQGADLHMAQLMSLPLTVSCFNGIQIGFAFLVLRRPVTGHKTGVCVCVCVRKLR